MSTAPRYLPRFLSASLAVRPARDGLQCKVHVAQGGGMEEREERGITSSITDNAARQPFET